MEALELRTVDGRTKRVAFRGAALPTVVYYFSSACGWCERNWPAVVELERRIAGRYRFISITADTPPMLRVLAEKSRPVETYLGLSEHARRTYGLAATPHTLVISRDARILEGWLGAYTGDIKHAIETYFEVKLPPIDTGRAASSPQRPSR